jgi:hypothetical protein
MKYMDKLPVRRTKDLGKEDCNRDITARKNKKIKNNNN